MSEANLVRVRTVERHVANVYAKIGASGRTALDHDLSVRRVERLAEMARSGAIAVAVLLTQGDLAADPRTGVRESLPRASRAAGGAGRAVGAALPPGGPRPPPSQASPGGGR